jgi:electron transfer flavoprotein beta subunit
MRIVVAYKWTRDPAEATVRADGTVDWSRAKPGLSAYDPWPWSWPASSPRPRAPS